MGHFCVICGAPLEPRIIEGREVEACPNDTFILWHDPKVSTAVVVELERGIVLGRRAIEPGSLPEFAFPSHRTVVAEYIKFPARAGAAALPTGAAGAPRAAAPSARR